MRIVFFLSDIQDLWLFAPFLRVGSEVVYANSRKVTSPAAHLAYLVGFGFKLHEFCGIDDAKFKSIMKNCDVFVTKECLPFTVSHGYVDKIFSLGWVGESAVTCTAYNILGLYAHHFCEEHFLELYRRRGFTNVHSPHPKYAALNGMTRARVCEIFGIDSSVKYATFFTSAIDQLSDGQRAITSSLVRWCHKNGVRIIQRNKMKHAARRWPIDLGDPVLIDESELLYHPGLLLHAISEFVVTMPSSLAIEADVMRAPCIAMWSDPPAAGDELLQEVMSTGRGYRLAQSDRILRIYPDDGVEKRLDEALDYIERRVVYDFSSEHRVHELLRPLLCE